MIALALVWVRAHGRQLATGGGLALVLVIGFCRGHDTPIPRREAHTIDSLDITRPMFVARIDTLIQRETTFVRESNRKAAVAEATNRAADSLRGVAIALQVEAEAAQDTSSRWRATALAWRRTADSLTVEVDTLRAARAAEHAARLEADARAASEAARRVALEDLSARLAQDVKTAGRCRVLFLACPSRAAVAVGGLVVGGAAAYVMTHPR